MSQITQTTIPAIPKHPALSVEPCPYFRGVYIVWLTEPVTCEHETINRRCARVGLNLHGYGHDVPNDRWYARVALAPPKHEPR